MTPGDSVSTADLLSSTLLDLAVGALLVYAVLHAAHRTSRTDLAPMRVARRHAMWAALLALAAGGVVGPLPFEFLYTPWTFREAPARDSVFAEDLVMALTPFVSLVGIYLIAQFTVPHRSGARGRSRGSDPRVVESRSTGSPTRRLRDHLPPGLTLATGFLVLLGFAAIILSASVPAIGPEDTFDGDGAALAVRIPGPYFASIAGIAYTTLVSGVVLTLLVIVRRRGDGTLTGAEDDIMRDVFVNRLLRTVALVAVLMVRSSVEFAAGDDSGWNALRFAVFVLWAATVLMTAATRPRVEPADVDAPRDLLPPSPAGSLPRARSVVLSGRRIGYAAWCLGVAPLLFSLGMAPGAVQLIVLTLAYLVFLGVQLWAEVILLKNHSRPSRPRVRRRLPAALLAALLALGVPALAAVVGTAWLALWVRTLPGASTQTALWWVSFALLLTGSAVVLSAVMVRPGLRTADETGEGELRAGSVARVLLMTVSGMAALAAFVLSDNRAALVPDDTLVQAVPYPPGAGQLDALVIILFLAAGVVAVLPLLLARQHTQRPATPEQVAAS
ncbi:hypothetical protein E8P82_08340 [Arthrobacter echini]|uniref:Uncharacterized protein n=1 Tax=Arthrobacter echini TaxID=1529066 RepID=A0A4S5E4W3_9MICC|nr:hypothetical protein [Arthrobacter echini]THJ66462.1 hypothetical protein E8P82_08340 [Arthrobacter echini]